jgi:hypothetical protein
VLSENIYLQPGKHFINFPLLCIKFFFKITETVEGDFKLLKCLLSDYSLTRRRKMCRTELFLIDKVGELLNSCITLGGGGDTAKLKEPCYTV